MKTKTFTNFNLDELREEIDNWLEKEFIRSNDIISINEYQAIDNSYIVVIRYS